MLAFSRVGSNVELDGEGGVEALATSDKVASVTRPRSPRNRAWRRRFESRPCGVRDHARLRPRFFARRRSAAQVRQHAPTAAQDPQNACTSPHTTQRPNRPSNALPPFTERLDRGVDRLHSPTRRARFPMRTPRRLGGSAPGLHLSDPRVLLHRIPFAMRSAGQGTHAPLSTVLHSRPQLAGLPPGPPPRPAPAARSSTSCPLRRRHGYADRISEGITIRRSPCRILSRRRLDHSKCAAEAAAKAGVPVALCSRILPRRRTRGR